MVSPRLVVSNEDEQDRFVEARMSVGGAGEPPGRDDMEHRVSALEKNFDKIDSKLDKLFDRLSAVEVGTAGIKGRVDSLPSTWQMITLVIGIVGTILGGAFLILKFGLSHAP